MELRRDIDVVRAELKSLKTESIGSGCGGNAVEGHMMSDTMVGDYQSLDEVVVGDLLQNSGSKIRGSDGPSVSDFSGSNSKPNVYFVSDCHYPDLIVKIEEYYADEAVIIPLLYPQMTIEGVSQEFGNIAGKIKPSDIIVFQLGGYETNPNRAAFHMCSLLLKVRNSQIFMVPIARNKVLSEEQLYEKLLINIDSVVKLHSLTVIRQRRGMELIANLAFQLDYKIYQNKFILYDNARGLKKEVAPIGEKKGVHIK